MELVVAFLLYRLLPTRTTCWVFRFFLTYALSWAGSRLYLLNPESVPLLLGCVLWRYGLFVWFFSSAWGRCRDVGTVKVEGHLHSAPV